MTGYLCVEIMKGHCSIRSEKVERYIYRRMTDQAIYNLLLSHAKQAGTARFSPHDLRRSFISELLDQGVDVVTVQQLAGHASVQTTAKYDRRGERAKKKAIGLLHVPYKKRQ